jgi:hypothetical protein
MKIEPGSNSGIQGFNNLGIEGILSILIYGYYALMPQSPIPKSLNWARISIDSVKKVNSF